MFIFVDLDNKIVIFEQELFSLRQVILSSQTGSHVKYTHF